MSGLTFPNMWQLAKTLPSNPQDDVDRLTELCRRGSDLAIPLINSMTKEQLDLKCKFGPNKEHLPITAAIMGNNIDVVKALVEKGVNSKRRMLGPRRLASCSVFKAKIK